MPNEKREPKFAKVYMKNFALVAMGSQSNELKVLGYILWHTSYANEFGHSVKEIAKAVGISTDTVRRILADMVRCDFLRKIPDSTRYMLNPACFVRGHYPHKAALQKDFDDLFGGKTQFTSED